MSYKHTSHSCLWLHTVVFNALTQLSLGGSHSCPYYMDVLHTDVLHKGVHVASFWDKTPQFAILLIRVGLSQTDCSFL